MRVSPGSDAKKVRTRGLSAQSEADSVEQVRGHWNRTCVDEASLFPNSDCADQVGCASLSFHRLTRPRGGRGMTAAVQVKS